METSLVSLCYSKEMKKLYNGIFKKRNMMFQKQAKKAQAAIEFLMTYGWMLLVVLIVGALIFSFVDFGSLIPNQINLNNNLQADPTRSLADSNTQNITVVFQYNGARKAEINATSSETYIQTVLNEQCNGVSVRNTDTNDAPEPASTFLNGQTGVLKFTCDTSGSNVLIQGDTVEGEISVAVDDPQTGITVPSTGDIRLTIS